MEGLLSTGSTPSSLILLKQINNVIAQILWIGGNSSMYFSKTIHNPFVPNLCHLLNALLPRSW